MLPRAPSLSICARCLTRRLFSSTSHAPSSEPFPSSPPPPRAKLPPPPSPPSGYSPLTSRRLISLSGADAATFLQGLTTASIAHPLPRGLYSAFLNAAGRVLHDVFIYPTSHISAFRELALSTGPDVPGYLIECDAQEQDTLFRWLGRYKLRAKVQLRKVDEGEWSIWSVWDDGFYQGRGELLGPGNWSTKTSNTYASLADSRAPGFGFRLLLPPGKHPSSLPRREDDPTHPLVPTTTEQMEVSEDSYRVRRILWGVPEGQQEIVKAQALPLESNLDLMRGVDFRKGCYVGQELTIRTAHTGVVRKRILPVRVYPGWEGREEESGGGLEYHVLQGKEEWDLPDNGADIVRVGGKRRVAGRWLGGVGNVGLALCRLEGMLGEGAAGSDEFMVRGREGRELRVRAFEPAWFGERKDVGIRR